ncbi:hypothetical protein evm_000869 [Chilo suppressalis]|nr:hypothetical protein evm_000869 [Chilo suppressalis]
MNWDNTTVLRFIELYKNNACIWNPKHENHKDRQSVNEAWKNIKREIGFPYTVKELKRKKESLMASYRGYKIKIKKSEISGEEVYQPMWFAFPLMDSFLDSVYSCSSACINATMNTEGVEKEEQDIDKNTTTKSNQYHSFNAKQTATPVAFKRRYHDPPELLQAQKQMNHAFNFMKKVYQRSRDNDDDECSVFGILIAKKLRRLTEEHRDIMMVKINQLFIDQRHNSSGPNSTSNVIPYSPSSSGYEVEVVNKEGNPLQEYILPNSGMESSIV